MDLFRRIAARMLAHTGDPSELRAGIDHMSALLERGAIFEAQFVRAQLRVALGGVQKGQEDQGALFEGASFDFTTVRQLVSNPAR